MFSSVVFLLLEVSVTVLSSSIRLVSPLNNGVGRVEVYHNGEWGTVCDDDVTDNFAKVVCRQIGRYENGFRPKVISSFGYGSGKIWLDDVHCTGTESSLDACPHKPWGDENCNHGEDVGVICDERSLTMKLTPNHRSGLLQVYHSGTWGIVCDDGFGKVEATVVCRALGYDSGHVTDEDSSRMMWLDDVDCSMNNTDLKDCKHNEWSVENCGSDEAVGLECYSFPEGSSAARLVSTTNTTGQGRLELYYKGQWGTVCSRGLGSEVHVATVVCRMLGYHGVGRYYGHSSGSGSVLLEDVHCKGTEYSINDCSHSKWMASNCPHSSDLVISCGSASDIQQSIRLVSSTSGAGRVEILHNNVWGTVCRTGFTDKEARVVCRMANHPWSGAFVSLSYGPGNGVIWLSNLNCFGNETSLDQCTHSSWGTTSCSHSYDVGVICTEARLTSGGSRTRGRLEIFYDDQWGTVCDQGFTNISAKVACRMVGQPSKHAHVALDGSFGQGKGRIWLGNVQCQGTETTVGACSHSSWGITFCTHSRDVGVICSYPPEIHLNPNTHRISIKAGNDVSVECVVDDANPATVSIAWSHNGRIVSGKVFQIRNVSKSDQGNLTCTASNGLGMTPGRAETAINVLYPPEIYIDPNIDVIKVHVGTSLNVKCIVSDGNPIVSSISWAFLDRNSYGDTFHIENVTLSDEGRLTCTAHNGVGTIPGRADTFIRVQEIAVPASPGWSMMHTVAVVIGGVALLIIAVLVVVIIHLCRKRVLKSETRVSKRETQKAIGRRNPANNAEDIYEKTDTIYNTIAPKSGGGEESGSVHFYEDIGTTSNTDISEGAVYVNLPSGQNRHKKK